MRFDFHQLSRNFRQTGLGILLSFPVGFNNPEAGSIEKITILPVSRLATSKKWPPGSITKLRGCFPFTETICFVASLPSFRISNTAIVLDVPRFVAYKYLPSGRT